jgi:hypothetical protein
LQEKKKADAIGAKTVSDIYHSMGLPDLDEIIQHKIQLASDEEIAAEKREHEIRHGITSSTTPPSPPPSNLHNIDIDQCDEGFDDDYFANEFQDDVSQDDEHEIQTHHDD